MVNVGPMDRLLSLLVEHGFRRGEFTLSSGAKSDFFIDCKPAVLRAEGHHLVGQRLWTVAKELAPKLQAVVGVELGGCSLASAVAMYSWQQDEPVDAVYVRKSKKAHGTQRLLEGAAHLSDGASVVVLEDTVTTGGSTLRAIEAVEATGLRVAGVVAVVDRNEGGAQAIADAGYRFKSLYTRDDFMEDA